MISEKLIMEKVKRWAATPVAKKKIERKTGLKYKPKLDVKKLAEEAANDMKEILYDHIHSDGNRNPNYPAVIDTFKKSDIIVGTYYIDADNKAKIEVGFDESKLHRDSLVPGDFDGIDNIVLLHMTGYHAEKAVYGVWLEHGFGSMKSATDRDPNDFMKRAIDEFNKKYKGKAHAELKGKYDIY